MRNFIKLTAFTAVCFVVVGLTAACDPKTDEQPEVDYVVPSEIGAVEVCERITTERRSHDVHCENGTEGYRWMYIRRGGHPELPAVGEKLFRRDVTSAKPTDVKVDRLPKEGGWWTKLGGVAS